MEPAQLQEPGDPGVRRVALSLLRDASEACEKLRDIRATPTGDRIAADDALHDFRVAVRRFRSWTRAFRSELRGSIRRKDRSRLREIVHATALARDSSVHLEWLREQRKSAGATHHAAFAWLNRRLEEDQERGWEDAVEAAQRFQARVPNLMRGLKSLCSDVDDASPVPLGVLIGELLLSHAEVLREALGNIAGAADAAPIHRARIDAKRLRYVAEQVAELTPVGSRVVKALKKLQDALGDLHDVHVFSENLGRDAKARDSLSAREHTAGIGLVKRRLHERGERTFALVQRTWLAPRTAPFFAQLHDLATEISRLARLGTEIERKYLVTRTPEEARGTSFVDIKQGYLPGKNLIERIRSERSPGAKVRWTRTVKAGAGISRVELEEVVDSRIGRALWRLTSGRRVRKRRYLILDDDGATWMVDEFLDRPLVIVEIEIPSADAHPTLPQWLTAILVREVTDELAFTNARLAR